MFHRLKVLIRVVLGFSRSEINGFLILLPLLILILLSAPIYRLLRPAPPVDSSSLSKLDSIVATWTWSPKDSARITPVRSLSSFDPNTASEDRLMELGIPEAVAKRIIRYRTKGGKFRIKSDFKKMHGLDSLLYLQLSSYLTLPDQKPLVKTPKRDTLRFVKSRVIEKFDLNQADTTQLKSVTGIGSVRAARIVKFRERLGGFITLAQVSEIYGLDTATQNNLLKRVFIAPDFHPKPILLNTATEQELANHPYLNRSLAKAIATYRFQHGRYQQIEDLLKIAVMREDTYNKIKPYLSLE